MLPQSNARLLAVAVLRRLLPHIIIIFMVLRVWLHAVIILLEAFNMLWFRFWHGICLIFNLFFDALNKVDDPLFQIIFGPGHEEVVKPAANFPLNGSLDVGPLAVADLVGQE